MTETDVDVGRGIRLTYEQRPPRGRSPALGWR